MTLQLVEDKPASAISHPASGRAVAALRTFFGDAYARGFSISLWDGTFVPARGAERFVFCINDAGALRALAPPVDLAAGRAFAAGRIDVRGDLECAFDMVVRAAGALTPLRKMKLLFELQSLPGRSMPPLREATLHGRPHSHVRDRSAIAHHYDRPVELYCKLPRSRTAVFLCLLRRARRDARRRADRESGLHPAQIAVTFRRKVPRRRLRLGRFGFSSSATGCICNRHYPEQATIRGRDPAHRPGPMPRSCPDLVARLPRAWTRAL